MKKLKIVQPDKVSAVIIGLTIRSNLTSRTNNSLSTKSVLVKDIQQPKNQLEIYYVTL